MEYINGKTLCLEYDELVPVIVSSLDSYKKLRGRGQISVWVVFQDGTAIKDGVGGNGRKVLIEFESMPPKYKQAVRKHYGDPYAYASKQPILNSLQWDFEAEKYYRDYILSHRRQAAGQRRRSNRQKANQLCAPVRRSRLLAQHADPPYQRQTGPEKGAQYIHHVILGYGRRGYEDQRRAPAVQPKAAES